MNIIIFYYNPLIHNTTPYNFDLLNNYNFVTCTFDSTNLRPNYKCILSTLFILFSLLILLFHSILYHFSLFLVLSLIFPLFSSPILNFYSNFSALDFRETILIFNYPVIFSVELEALLIIPLFFLFTVIFLLFKTAAPNLIQYFLEF